MPTTRESAYRWDRLGSLPRKGWGLIGVEDLGEPDHECEACGFPDVRYVHELVHADVEDTILVGCICSEHLTGDYTGPRTAERLLRNRQARLRRVLDLDRWKRTWNGNRRIKYRGHRLVLYPSRFGEGWRINVGSALGRRDHPTAEAAILAAVNHIDPPRVAAWEAVA